MTDQVILDYEDEQAELEARRRKKRELAGEKGYHDVHDLITYWRFLQDRPWLKSELRRKGRK